MPVKSSYQHLELFSSELRIRSAKISKVAARMSNTDGALQIVRITHGPSASALRHQISRYLS